MIKVTQTSPSGKVTITVEGDTVSDVFERLSEASEIFFVTASAKQKDGVVESDDIRFVTRMIEDNKYHEAVVQSGPMKNYKLAFGSKKKGGGLFPKREIPETNRIPGLFGWFLYRKDDETKPTEEKKEEAKAATPF